MASPNLFRYTEEKPSSSMDFERDYDGSQNPDIDWRNYTPAPTNRLFHASPEQIRAIVGAVGSGKTSAATWEVCYYLPVFLWQTHKIRWTRWCVVRNTYVELMDTTLRTIIEWFPNGHWAAQRRIYTLRYQDAPIVAELWLRSCDRPDDVKKFKSMELTGYWADEANEIPDEVKLMLKNRIGRYPKKSPVRFGIETTNPPDTEHTMYHQFKWITPIPGPIPEKAPLEGHVGFWQRAGENADNLRPGYYEDLRRDYADNPEWIAIYIEGKPGILAKGKLVYNNFKREVHVANGPLLWNKSRLYRGWDNSGNIPACLVAQMVGPLQIQILKEYHHDKMGITDFTKYVVNDCNILFPGAEYVDYADPAGANKYSKAGGGFTSNAQLMGEAGVNVIASEQNFTARAQSVDSMLARRDGVLIDPGCTRYINGFIGGYCFPKIHSVVHGDYFGEEPMKNRFSHIHDAGQYLFVKLFKSSGSCRAGKYRPKRAHRTPGGRGRR